MMVLTMPSIFYFAKKSNWHLISAVLVVICCFITGSRGGMVLGGVQFFAGMLYLIVSKKECRAINLTIVFLLISAFLLSLDRLLGFYADRLAEGLIRKDEGRVRLILRGLEDFRSSPFFGKGIGYAGNYDLYTPRLFEMSWYQNAPIQVMGSMGILGIAAYMYQFTKRIMTLFRKIDPYTPVFALSFAGTIMISMIEPGEFMPIPFGLITVFSFLLIDNAEEEKA